MDRRRLTGRVATTAFAVASLLVTSPAFANAPPPGYQPPPGELDHGTVFLLALALELLVSAGCVALGCILVGKARARTLAGTGGQDAAN